YSIGEVSEITGIEPHVLRYWETVFDDLKPRKNNAGNRIFRENDLKVIEELKKLIKEKKYSTKGAKQVLQGKQTVIEDRNELSAGIQKDLREIRFVLKTMLKKL